VETNIEGGQGPAWTVGLVQKTDRRRYSPAHSALHTRWSWVVSHTPRPLDSREKGTRYSLGKKQGRPHNFASCKIL